MSYSQLEITSGDTVVTAYYSNTKLPTTIDGCIIADFEVIYENAVPQRIVSLKDGTDSKDLDELLMSIVLSVITLQPTYIGIKDGKPS